jgi:dTMP kinase
MTGKFITFEGIEGCGKTTQIKLLNDYLLKKGLKTVLSREPGGTKIGDAVRGILLDASNKMMSPLTELILYGASRAQHLEELIKPAIAEGKVVLCDRYSDSTTAYQGAARRLSSDILKRVDDVATGGFKPDLTIILDVDPAEGLKRAKGRSAPDRFEQEELSFHERVRDGYLKLARSEPERIKVVDGSGGVEEIHKEIVKLVENVL